MRALAPALALAAFTVAGCSTQPQINNYATASHGFNNGAGTNTGSGTTSSSGTGGGTTSGTTTGGASTGGGSGTTGMPDSGPPPVASGIEFVGTSHPFLGVDYQASYSINPVNTFNFRVAATDDGGVPNTPVSFAAGASNAQGSALLDVSGTPVPSDAGFSLNSDSQGNVSAQIQSGTFAGQVSVIATVTLPNGKTASVSGSSSVVGTQPSRGNAGISCKPVNLPVFSGNNPVCALKSDYDGTTTCTVILGDRFGNAIGISVPVHFYAEAGLWQSQTVNTPDYGQSSTTNLPGTAVNTLKTAQASLPLDVSPLAGEPSTSGLCLGTVPRTYNPRDGLVTVMAAFTGEEAFTDEFALGYWQPGDPFFDLPQPFVDSDDSSVWHPGDICAGSSTDGGCDGPNHRWDGNTNVWVENWIVYTGDPVTTTWDPSPAPTILGLPAYGWVTWADQSINIPAAQTICNVTSPSAGEPTGFQSQYPVAPFGANPTDQLGMTASQIPTCDAGYIIVDGGMVLNTICNYQAIVTGFSAGFTNKYQVTETTFQDGGGAPYCIYSSATLFADTADTSQNCGIAIGP
jgi:hypothetical protein